MGLGWGASVFLKQDLANSGFVLVGNGEKGGTGDEKLLGMSYVENGERTLASMAQWTECQPVN